MTTTSAPVHRRAADDWQGVMARAFRDPVELCRVLGLPPELAAAATRPAEQFPLLVPRPYLTRTKPGNPGDPLLRQILPVPDELDKTAGFGVDPLGEKAASASPGLLSKYTGRSLILTTGACAVHCRFCFRRHRPYAASGTVRPWEPAINHIARQPATTEVILSGGDPLMLPDEQLAELVARLAAIPHIRRLRLHTRLPVMIPRRVTDDLLEILVDTRLRTIVVVHVNHPAEIDGPVAAVLKRLREAGVPVLSQAVLLRGVNDRVETLATLYERLADLGVMPYYLHQLDPVAGAAHFHVPEAAGIELIGRLRQQLPGYCVPRYVKEVPGTAHKQALA